MEVSGICLVIDTNLGVLPFPQFSDPDVGPHYAKKTIPGVNDIDGVRAACTYAIFESLIALHCAKDPQTKTAVWRAALVYDSNGMYAQYGCDDDVSCYNVSCL